MEGSDGVILYAAAHPRAPWWKRPWYWLRLQWTIWRIGKYTVTEEICIDEDTGEVLDRDIR